MLLLQSLLGSMIMSLSNQRLLNSNNQLKSLLKKTKKSLRTLKKYSITLLRVDLEEDSEEVAEEEVGLMVIMALMAIMDITDISHGETWPTSSLTLPKTMLKPLTAKKTKKKSQLNKKPAGESTDPNGQRLEPSLQASLKMLWKPNQEL